MQGPLGPRTFVVLFLSLPFRGIRVGTPTNLEGGSGRSGLDLPLFLKDILGCTKLIPVAVGNPEEKNQYGAVDGEDGIGK